MGGKFDVSLQFGSLPGSLASNTKEKDSRNDEQTGRSSRLKGSEICEYM
ncbi:hypothetical protein HHX47_DHR1002052 [Lentinula edodes]|nr:hypothetical protein HHX47_DHR1002052 [Lentinula edodes]